MRTVVALALGSTVWAGTESVEEQPDPSNLSIEQLAQIKATAHLENGDPSAQLVKRSVYAGARVQF